MMMWMENRGSMRILFVSDRRLIKRQGGKGWDDLVIDDIEETDTMILNCTSGTTSNPKAPILLNVANDSVLRRLTEGHILRL